MTEKIEQVKKILKQPIWSFSRKEDINGTKYFLSGRDIEQLTRQLQQILDLDKPEKKELLFGNWKCPDCGNYVNPIDVVKHKKICKPVVSQPDESLLLNEHEISIRFCSGCSNTGIFGSKRQRCEQASCQRVKDFILGEEIALQRCRQSEAPIRAEYESRIKKLEYVIYCHKEAKTEIKSEFSERIKAVEFPNDEIEEALSNREVKTQRLESPFETVIKAYRAKILREIKK